MRWFGGPPAPDICDRLAPRDLGSCLKAACPAVSMSSADMRAWQRAAWSHPSCDRPPACDAHAHQACQHTAANVRVPLEPSSRRRAHPQRPEGTFCHAVQWTPRHGHALTRRPCDAQKCNWPHGRPVHSGAAQSAFLRCLQHSDSSMVSERGCRRLHRRPDANWR